MRVAQWENRLMEERSTQIFKTLQKQQEDLKQEAEVVDEKQEEVWREQGYIFHHTTTFAFKIIATNFQNERLKRPSSRSGKLHAGPVKSTAGRPC